MDKKQIHEIKPVVIRTRQGKIKDVCLMNQKSYTKSIEQNRLWVLHRDTGRVLPYEAEFQLLGIKSQASWFEAVIEGEEAPQGEADSSPLFENTVEAPAVTRRSASVSGNKTAFPQTEDSDNCGFILSQLEHIIRERYQSMPEGSYTSHLFSSGPEKIRKKTGEEAIELILADTPERLIYEAADFLYHLAVLLVSEGLSYEQICIELQRRHLSS